MYIHPFWCYRFINDEQVIVTNQLNGHQATRPYSFVEKLHTADSTATGLWVTEAQELSLAFQDKKAAHSWFRESEKKATLQTPVIDQIELTNRCPYTCKMCPRTSFMTRPIGNMDLSLFEQIIQQVSGHQRYLALHHFGESLSHPRLPEAVKIAQRYNIDSGLSCNPPSLHPKLAQRLLDAGIANLLLSLDALDTETYRNIRGPMAAFERADHHIRELVRYRNGGNHHTFINLQMINMHCNHKDADRFLDYCREVGVDYGVVVRLGKWDFDDSHMSAIGEYTSPGYLPYCSRPWQSLVVLWDGRVVPCCHDYDGLMVLGDLKHQSLEEIWGSDPAMSFRDHHYNSKICRGCAFSLWSREEQREREGFLPFHLERSEARKEWSNPASKGRIDGRALFNGFDVVS